MQIHFLDMGQTCSDLTILYHPLPPFIHMIITLAIPLHFLNKKHVFSIVFLSYPFEVLSQYIPISSNIHPYSITSRWSAGSVPQPVAGRVRKWMNMNENEGLQVELPVHVGVDDGWWWMMMAEHGWIMMNTDNINVDQEPNLVLTNRSSLIYFLSCSSIF